VAELAALEMLCTGNRTVGSNPTLSARNNKSRIQNPEFRSQKKRKSEEGFQPLHSGFWILTPEFRSSPDFWILFFAESLMKKRFSMVLLMGAVAVCALSLGWSGQAQVRRGQICGDPTMSCPGQADFQPHDLPFRIPKTAVIWESETFYAIILQSVNAKNNCEAHVSEDERLEAQALFPHHKVFADRCPEPGTLFYTNTNSDYRFMAVYAGRTRAEATRMLARVKATGRYPSANLRQMRAGFNGT
jgi:hypothetical protein